MWSWGSTLEIRMLVLRVFFCSESNQKYLRLYDLKKKILDQNLLFNILLPEPAMEEDLKERGHLVCPRPHIFYKAHLKEQHHRFFS